MNSGTLTIADNSVSGDLAARDINKNIYINARVTTAMTKVVQQYMAETQADKSLTEWTEKLGHYMSNVVNSDIRSLQEKLTAAGRNELIQDALFRKQSAYKAIMKQQGSRSAQIIYSFLMAEIVIRYEQAVMPLVDEGAARAVVDMAMLEKVISPALDMLEENPLMLDKMDIQALVYFLAGNCYIRWDSC